MEIYLQYRDSVYIKNKLYKNTLITYLTGEDGLTAVIYSQNGIIKDIVYGEYIPGFDFIPVNMNALNKKEVYKYI